MKALFLAALIAFVTTAVSANGHHRVRAPHHRSHRHVVVHGHDRRSKQLFENPEQLPVEDAGAYWTHDRGGRLGPIERAAGGILAAMERVVGMRRQPGWHRDWCGDGLAWVAKLDGWKVPPGFSKATSWTALPRLSGPRPGAIAVWSHHVGVVVAWPRIISANFGHRVAEGVQRRQRLLGFYALQRI